MKKLSIPILSFITGATTAISLLLRLICLFFFHDSIGYYKTGAVLPIISNILFALSIVFFFVATILCIDKKQSVEPTHILSQYVAILPVGAIIFHVIRIFSTPFNDTNVNKYLLALSAVITAVFFLLLSLSNKKYKTVTFYVGLGALIYVFLLWMYAYFDFVIPINSTDKIFFYLACASAVLFIFNEMCACVGFVRSRFYYFSLFTSIITLSVASVSAIIGYICGVFKAYITLEADVFFVTLLVFAITRLIDAQKSTVKNDTVTDDTEENFANDSE